MTDDFFFIIFLMLSCFNFKYMQEVLKKLYHQISTISLLLLGNYIHTERIMVKVKSSLCYQWWNLSILNLFDLSAVFGTFDHDSIICLLLISQPCHMCLKPYNYSLWPSNLVCASFGWLVHYAVPDIALSPLFKQWTMPSFSCRM